MANHLRQKSGIALILFLAFSACHRDNHNHIQAKRIDDGTGHAPERPGDYGSDHAPVPEPATLLLLGGGLAALAASRRKKKGQAL